MTTPVRVTGLEAHILATKAALDGARAAWQHSPNGETRRIVDRVEQDLNRLLDRLPRQREPAECG